MRSKKTQLKPLLMALAAFWTISAGASEPVYRRVADKLMIEEPSLVGIREGEKKSWRYDVGMLARAYFLLGESTGEKSYDNYGAAYYDYFLEPDGTIRFYKEKEYNLDRVQPGRAFFYLMKKSAADPAQTARYRKAAETLMMQMKGQPKTSPGAYWHKQVYPWQVWLDGIYMGSPFMALYAKTYNQPAWYDVVTRQCIVAYEKTYDPATGLLRHAWDESCKQAWSDPKSGQSPHVWGRAVGWYYMALVDVLGILPESHADYGRLLELYRTLTGNILKYCDPATGLWYQVMDMAGREGNYIEMSCSNMFIYGIARGVNKGYLSREYAAVALEKYASVIKNFVVDDRLTRICAGAGLGGNPYRDGSYDYYIGETIATNDAKGVAPFIFAGLECDKFESSQPLAFPGAEGAGKYALGGRGGDVYEVTHTGDAGVGSLRHAIESATRPRTIIFKTSGTIEMEKELVMKGKKQITIAGQTAPGDGITLKNRTFLIQNCEDIVVRYIRVRFGDQGPRPTTKDGITIEDCKRIILDHLSVSWTVDGMMDTRRCEDFTVQWCIFSEPLHNSIHKEGPHSKMMSIRDVGGATSLHHNLLVSSYQRFPTLGSRATGVDQAYVDFRNNVLYNYVSGTNIGNATHLVVNNYYRWGPNCKAKSAPFTVKTERDTKEVRAYIQGNWFDPDFPHAIYNRENYKGVNYDYYDEQYAKQSSDFKPGATRETLEITTEPDLGWMKLSATQTPQDGYKSVMASAGASLVRDAVDNRIVAEVEARTNKIIDSQDEVGGWPQLKALPAPQDNDGDGIPDAWEEAHGLNPNDPSDGNALTLDKERQYTNLEVYLNSLIKQ